MPHSSHRTMGVLTSPLPFINGYHLLYKLDQGSRAEVFLGLSKQGLLKAVKCYTREAAGRFDYDDNIKECRLIDHNVSNVVKIEEVGKVWTGTCEVNYTVMEYLEGLTLKDFMQTRAYNSRFIAKVVATLYRATSELFEINIVHRDIKPANIIVTPEGEIVLIDMDFISKYNTRHLSEEEHQDLVAKMHTAHQYNHVLDKDARSKWKVMNLHCIGNVLNDMIVTKKSINFLDIWLYIQWGLKIVKASGRNYSFPTGKYKTVALMTLKLVRRWFLHLKVYPS